MSNTLQSLKDSIENFRADFDFIASNVVKTDEDMEILEEAISRAFKCVPSCSVFPSQQEEAQQNQEMAMASLQEFASRCKSKPTQASLAKRLFAIAETAWQKMDHEAAELSALFEGEAIVAAVQGIGRQANDLGGILAMQSVAGKAFCTASPMFPGEQVAKDEMSAQACSELNWLWSGIGNWRA